MRGEYAISDRTRHEIVPDSNFCHVHRKNFINTTGLSEKAQGHPTSKLAKNHLREISRLLVMFKDCLKSCFYQLEKFDLFGFLSRKLKCPKILGYYPHFRNC